MNFVEHKQTGKRFLFIGIKTNKRLSTGHIVAVLIALLLSAGLPVFGQTDPGLGDQREEDGQFIPDSTASDTLVQDTTRAVASLDTILLYSANNIVFTFEPRVTLLDGNAKLRYRQMELEAHQIDVHWDDDLLYARSEPDLETTNENSFDTLTVVDTAEVKPISVEDSSFVSGEDVSGTETRSSEDDSLTIIPAAAQVKPPAPLVVEPEPRVSKKVKMMDGTQTLYGKEMMYNLNTRRGQVIEGTTQFQDGWYTGRSIKRVGPEVYNIRSGFYTTCDVEEPHYGFWSRDMKLMVKDKVIARPVVLMFGPVPVAIIPFGVFPARGGRRSGLIVPTYGESSSSGRYFTGLGYYYAPNDYWDTKGQLDFYERYGILLRGDLNYALRYRLRGGVSGSFVNKQRGGMNQKQWDAKVDHVQELSPSANLNVNAYFLSDVSYLKNISQNPNERLRQTIRSDATLSKRWPGTPYSASINLHHSEELATGKVNQMLPQATFSRNQTPLIPPAEGAKPEDARWWNKIYYNYRGQGINNRAVNVIQSVRYETIGDSLVRVDTESKSKRARSGLKHDLTFTASTKPGYFVFTPRASYSESWFDEWLTYEFDSAGRADTTKHNGFIARRTFNVGAGLSTKLYGLFYPRLAGLEAIRHTLTPSLNFTYTPDFSEREWGYYDVFTNSLGRKFYYDRFAGSVVGATPRGRQESLGIGVDNLFEYKRLKDGKETKGEMFSMGLSTSHNFAADSLKWSDLASNLRIKPLGENIFTGVSGLGLDFSASHSFYDVRRIEAGNSYSYVRVNESPAGYLRLVSFDLTTSLKFASGKVSSGAPRDTSNIITGGLAEDRFRPAIWTPSPLPWQAGISFRYGENRSTPERVQKDIWSNVNLEVQATRNWKVNSDLRIDLVNKQIVSTTISIYRDLHCWQGSLTWNPVGLMQGYYLNISVKSAQLKDVKVEKREGGGGFLGF